MALGSILIAFIAQHTMVSFFGLFLKIHYLLTAFSLSLSHNIAFHPQLLICSLETPFAG